MPKNINQRLRGAGSYRCLQPSTNVDLSVGCLVNLGTFNAQRSQFYCLGLIYVFLLH